MRRSALAGLVLVGLSGCATADPAVTLSAPQPFAIPQGATSARFTRITDPATVCTMVAAGELGGGQFGSGRAQKREGGLTVTWRNVQTGAGPKKVVTCDVDTTAGQVTSLKADGVEQLEQPQPI